MTTTTHTLTEPCPDHEGEVIVTVIEYEQGKGEVKRTVTPCPKDRPKATAKTATKK